MKLLNYPGLEQKIGLKEIMTHGQRVIPKVKLNLKLQFKTKFNDSPDYKSQVYVITLMHTFLLKEP